MGWKNWSYWLKGAIIGLILGILLYGIAQADFFGCKNLFPNESELMCYGENFFAGKFGWIFWPLLGAVVGGIIGKIKFKK